ncbi:unnamed protein product [Tilletia laevis]|uniref:Ankyrin repeat protein n=1 Tax=Tilletia caries TaxID=13290 RepID=A0A177VET4_9BASI|nr:hypothetical protein CF336_g4496 [Tilletia laevis]KAE8244302.1 hypothetical protein A4X03_0g7579 [Tilletia caries]CAD6973137.1 unnamed protein product [Tilletia controversa]KAE8201473.1 hypothetical protein CF335_g3732 [Tilletia laevis]CAD6888726.1 unnamed protein product [Tilletia caries]
MTPVAVPTASHQSDAAPATAEHSAPAPAPAPASTERPTLTPEALDFASKMFDLARAGDLKLIHYLAAGLPPNMANQRGDSLLMLAAYHGHEDLVAAMLGKTVPVSSSTTRTTSESDSTETETEVAIPTLPPTRQPDVNLLNAKHQSILAGTVFKTYPSIAALLVQAGADPLAGEPSAEETAKMFRKWEDDGLESGYRDLFENAPGRGRGGSYLKEEMAPAVVAPAGTEPTQPSA